MGVSGRERSLSPAARATAPPADRSAAAVADVPGRSGAGAAAAVYCQ